MIHLGLRMRQQVVVAVIPRTTGALLQSYDLRVMFAQLAGKRPDVGKMPQVMAFITRKIKPGGPGKGFQGQSIIETVLLITPFAAPGPVQMLCMQNAG